uniref:Uncharacterized protein n=1 Tax=Caulobacter phage BL57 TaxID=3348355 RepID=A0AB74UHB0_9VIRU
MSDRLKIKEVAVAQQDAVYHWRGEEGDEYQVMSLVHVQTLDGRWFLMPAMRPYTRAEEAAFDEACGEILFGMKTRYSDPQAFAAIVRAAGSIDPDLWVEYQPDTRTTEERFHDLWVEEQYDRQQYAA